MNQVDASGPNKRVKKGKNFIGRGSLQSLAHQKVSSLTTKRNILSIKSKEKILGLGSEKHQLPPDLTFPEAPVVQEQMKQVPRDSTTSTAAVVLEKQQQVPRDSTTSTAAVVLEKQQQVKRKLQLPHDSTTSAAVVQEKRQHQKQQQVPHSSSTPAIEASSTPAIEASSTPAIEAAQSEEPANENTCNTGVGSSAPKRKRGTTQMQNVHGRNNKKLITLNRRNQPVGPKEEDVKEFGSFLGTLARNASWCPLNVKNWKKITSKDAMWNYTKTKYVISDAAKDWSLKSIQSAWRKQKCQVKKDHYTKYPNDEMRMANRPSYISETQFKDLLQYWDSDEAKEAAKKNKQNRSKLKYPHTVGKTSFALIREKIEKETSMEVSSKEMFVATRKRDSARVYKESYADTSSKIAEMDRIESEDGSQSVDAFAAVMGPEHPGYVRLHGLGVTKTMLKGKSGDSGCTINATDEMQKMLEELEDRMHQQMLKKLEEQKNAMRQEITLEIVTQIQSQNPELRLDTNMLTFSGRPSAGSNNDGGENEQREGDSSDED